MIDLDLIRIDGGTQSRVELNEETVAEYRDAYLAGAEFPPVIVFFDGTDRWLADGFHRYFGAKAASRTVIHENITPGSRRDAVLHSLKANAKHGLKRTNADKRKAVEMMLADDEWAAWSDNQIAQACGVSDKTVAAVRIAIFGNSEDAPTIRTVVRNGKTYQQDTSNIGNTVAPAPAPVPASTSLPAGPAAAAPTDDLELAPAPSPAAPASATEPEQAGEIDELRATVKELQEKLAEMAADLERLATENAKMRAVFEADDRLVAALAEVGRERDMNAVLRSRVDGLQEDKNGLIRRVNAMQRAQGGRQ